MTAHGATSPLPRVPAKVGLPKRERLFSVVGGNASSCPKPDLPLYDAEVRRELQRRTKVADSAGAESGAITNTDLGAARPEMLSGQGPAIAAIAPGSASSLPVMRSNGRPGIPRDVNIAGVVFRQLRLCLHSAAYDSRAGHCAPCSGQCGLSRSGRQWRVARA